MRSRLYEEGYNESLLRAVAALNETPASTEATLVLLQKHWDLPRGEAEQLLSQERYEGFFQRDFARYLTMYEGFSEEKARAYTTSHINLLALRKIERPWAIEYSKLYRQIEKQKPQIKGKVRLSSEIEE